MNIKKLLTSITLILSTLFVSTLSSCLGEFKAFTSLKDWNNSVTGNRFVNNLLFWVLWIIPVYSLFMLADLIIFNLLEFWTGSNPLGLAPGQSESQLMTYNGKDYIMTATKDKMTLTDAEGKFVSALTFDRESNSWSVTQDGQTTEVVSIDNFDGENVYYTVNSKDGQSMKINANEIHNPMSFWAFK